MQYHVNAQHRDNEYDKSMAFGDAKTDSIFPENIK